MCWSVAVHCNLGLYSLSLVFLEKEANGLIAFQTEICLIRNYKTNYICLISYKTNFKSIILVKACLLFCASQHLQYLAWQILCGFLAATFLSNISAHINYKNSQMKNQISGEEGSSSSHVLETRLKNKMCFLLVYVVIFMQQVTTLILVTSIK